jgi:spore coat protein A
MFFPHDLSGSYLNWQFFGEPVDIPQDGLVLSPAERADLIVDFRALRGQRLTLVNTAGVPFDNSPATQPAGMPDLENRLPHPEVMEFRVSSQPVHDPFLLPTTLSSSYRRLEPDRLLPSLPVPQTGFQHRVVAMVEYPEGMLIFQELAEVPDEDSAAGEALMAIADEQGKTRRYRHDAPVCYYAGRCPCGHGYAGDGHTNALSWGEA